MCVYVHKMCEDKFGDCKKLFSWLGQKVNKKIDRYMLPLQLQEHGRCTTPGELVR